MFDRIRKARIQPGFPKLAKYAREIKSPYPYYFPTTSKGWPSVSYTPKTDELVVIAGVGWGGRTYYFVPFHLLATGQIPVGSVLTWTKNYIVLPLIEQRHLQILE